MAADCKSCFVHRRNINLQSSIVLSTKQDHHSWHTKKCNIPNIHISLQGWSFCHFLGSGKGCTATSATQKNLPGSPVVWRIHQGMRQIPSLSLPPTPKSAEDVADALQKHLNDTKEQALPLLMCSLTKQHTVPAPPPRDNSECNECSKWVCSFFKVG